MTEPMNMHTDAQHGVKPMNMHTDVTVSASGSTVTITGLTTQGARLTVTLPKKIADVVKSKVGRHVTAPHPAKASASATSPAVYHFDATAQVTGDTSHGVVVTGPAMSQGTTSTVQLTFTPTATGYLGAQRADL